MFENVKIGANVTLRTMLSAQLQGRVRGIERHEFDEEQIVSLLLETSSGKTHWVDLQAEIPLSCVVRQEYLN